MRVVGPAGAGVRRPQFGYMVKCFCRTSMAADIGRQKLAAIWRLSPHRRPGTCANDPRPRKLALGRKQKCIFCQPPKIHLSCRCNVL